MSSKIKASFLFSFVASLLLSGLSCYSQSYKNEFGIMIDNDYYVAFQQDRYYTDGTFAYFRHALKQENLNAKFEKKIVDFEIGQKIYNPFWSHVPDVKQHDRPFAGYLYGSAAMGWFYKNGSVLKASAQLGVIGPSAFGEETQTFFHKEILKAYYTVEGWEYQVKDEIAINFDVSYQSLFYHSANRILDISGTSSVLIGNTFTGANAGLLFRFGNLNPFYESSYANSRIKNKKGDNRRTPLELFLFTKPQLNFAAYDATIQGGLFRSDKGPVTFGIKNWVYSQQIGFNFAWKHLSSKFIVTLKTKEIDGPAKAYHYGSAVFAYNFN
ncbi:MAG: lipid A deacylase LpxR family protein [Pedobacter sp.]|nr:lipid A deacylase LpxR family protein [Pedobacter sp.]